MSAGYFIHRVGPAGPKRDRNVEMARLWVRWLVDVTDLAILAPWLVYVECLDETHYRARGLRDGRAFASLSPIRVGLICGPEVSDGCDADRATLLGRHVACVDFTPMGREMPPEFPPAELKTWRDFLRRVFDRVAPPLARVPTEQALISGLGRVDFKLEAW